MASDGILTVTEQTFLEPNIIPDTPRFLPHIPLLLQNAVVSPTLIVILALTSNINRNMNPRCCLEAQMKVTIWFTAWPWCFGMRDWDRFRVDPGPKALVQVSYGGYEHWGRRQGVPIRVYKAIEDQLS
eukprot:1336119-Amorphochlora_amoeboformis.AAC.1